MRVGVFEERSRRAVAKLANPSCVLGGFALIFTCFQIGLAGLDDGLVAFYPFDGDANDVSGNGNHGVIAGAVLVEDRFGKADGAYAFNGRDTRIRVPLSLEPSTFTLAVWMRTTDQDRGTLWTSDPDTFHCHHGTELGVRSGRLWANLDPNSRCRNGSELSSEAAVNDGAWHHVVLSYDGRMRIYVDGVLHGERASGYTRTGAPITIGMTPNSGTRDFSERRFLLGAIDEIRLYDRRLPDDEILELSRTFLFQRGDANTDGTLDSADAVTLLSALFRDPASLSCEKSGDVDDSGFLDITDAVWILRFLFFAGFEPPPAPFGACGEDRTPDTLSCDSFVACR